MQPPISNLSLETMRRHIAGAKDPIVAGVAVASVSGGLGMALLALTLEVTRRRKSFAGDRARLRALLKAVHRESARLMRFADEDIAAFQKYRDSLKRERGRNTAIRKIVQTPLSAAGSAARGLDFCAEAISLVPSSVVSDLGAAAALLAGTVRAILLTVDANASQLPAASALRRAASKQRGALETAASRQADRILTKIARLT